MKEALIKTILIILIVLGAGKIAIELHIRQEFKTATRCSDFTTHESAQQAYLKDPNRFYKLDRDRDGEACETLPKQPIKIIK